MISKALIDELAEQAEQRTYDANPLLLKKWPGVWRNSPLREMIDRGKAGTRNFML